MINASIIGANGYTGLELMNILSTHPMVQLKHLVSRSNVGASIMSVYPSLLNLKDRLFEDVDIDEIAKDTDVVFLCLPHSASAEMGKSFYDKGIKVIDLSADFRYKNIDTYELWYKVTHPHKELNKKAVYGMTEIYRDEIATASLVGNPGCYTTASILSLFPLLKNSAVSAENIIIDAKSGTSGAGRKAEVSQLFSEISESFKAYGVTNHRHTSEIEEQLSFAAEKTITLSFTPHLLPIKRGILTTIYCNLTTENQNISKIYDDFYKNSKFVTVLPEGILPEIKQVAGSNNVIIGFKIDRRLNRLVIVTVIDNLIKGASGQAVQNMNVMFGLNEETGLPVIGRYL